MNGLMQFVLWMYGMTWAGTILGILVSRKKENNGQ